MLEKPAKYWEGRKRTITSTRRRKKKVKVEVPAEDRRERAARLKQQQKIATEHLKARPDYVKPLLTGKVSAQMAKVARDVFLTRLQALGSPRNMTDEQASKFALYYSLLVTDNEAIRTRIAVKMGELNIVKAAGADAEVKDLGEMMRAHLRDAESQMEQRLKLEMRRTTKQGDQPDGASKGSGSV